MKTQLAIKHLCYPVTTTPVGSVYSSSPAFPFHTCDLSLLPPTFLKCSLKLFFQRSVMAFTFNKSAYVKAKSPGSSAAVYSLCAFLSLVQVLPTIQALSLNYLHLFLFFAFHFLISAGQFFVFLLFSPILWLTSYYFTTELL